MMHQSEGMVAIADAIDKLGTMLVAFDVEPMQPRQAVRLDEITQRLDDCVGDLRNLAGGIAAPEQ